ncbi:MULTISPECIES: GGDEF domain-containing protein [unclassified Agarivorans]|uniref:GGDEF domain-containing protein n=1 Tax=unclassified Agarivorans TaxID=2636026 RepID=UPI0026E11721|nr:MULTISPECIES: GGDEF domain-containing protein [unclassified Agarivorans]MDO6684641.1 GGDEF domain-containing protein [Agarivorans sp. 3_MG-2023]MDO6714806.1 GGDEF domain-containing protein [Agarivorans sp. 2_MG-2023]
MKVCRQEIYYPLLVIFTISLMLWQQFGMDITLTYPVNQRVDATLLNDDINGGASIGTISTQNDSLSLRCKTVSSNTFPFCSMLIPLASKQSQYADLSKFDTLNIDLTTVDLKRDTVLIYLLNHEQNLPNGVDKISHTRANIQAINPTIGRAQYRLALNQFYVPSWWVFAKPFNIDTAAKLDNVEYLQIATGDSRSLKDLEIALHAFSFSGKWINAKDLYFLLLSLWIASIIVHAIYLAGKMHSKYITSKSKAEELNKINSFLSIERDKYKTMAKHDPLTKLLNRAGLSGSLSKLMSEFSHSSQAASLIMFDIDHFKLINDQHGHDTGDQVLISISQKVSEMIRDQDVFARWGGEEFVIVCPNTQLQGACVLAENVRAQIANSQLIHQGQVTSSFGVAQLNSANIDTWFKRADEALYKAKTAGRNRVELS